MKNKVIYLSLINAVIIALFLFYIDEGYYNFAWMKSTGNWIVFFLYAMFLSIILMVLNFILQYKLNLYIITAINLILLPSALLYIFM